MTTCRMAISIVLVFGSAGAAHSQESATAPSDRPASSPDRTTPTDPLEPNPLSDVKTPASPASKPKSEQATFGAGCFWHVEAVFERLKGVNSAVSGYAGGVVPYPSYEMVHEGTTGHAEVVMVDYDPEVISFDDLLKVFWKSHDPTSINRQGEDVGPQYRSVVFYHNDEQRKATLRSYKALTQARVFRSPIVTQLVPMRAHSIRPKTITRTIMAASPEPARGGGKRRLPPRKTPEPGGPNSSPRPTSHPRHPTSRPPSPRPTSHPRHSTSRPPSPRPTSHPRHPTSPRPTSHPRHSTSRPPSPSRNLERFWRL